MSKKIIDRAESYSKHSSDINDDNVLRNFLDLLKNRFEKNISFHFDVNWETIHSKLVCSETKLFALLEMEKTGGEPEYFKFNSQKNTFIFVDCSAESPVGRRSLCYDYEAFLSRKENKPKGSALEMAKDMGVEIMDEPLYNELQRYGNFDCKTSSWLKTSEEIRKQGGAIFGDKRYNQVFIYHNGAESYYASRGFRAYLEV
jgi:hypothetical protein